jgi:superfamily II DNA helicase RecQ
VPAYVIFPDRTIAEILARRPSSPAELAGIHGLGPSRLARFGRDLYAIVKHVLDDSAADLPPADAAHSAPARVRTDGSLEGPAAGLYHALASWRRARAATEDVPPFHVFHNRVLDEIARTRPRSREELAAISGIGPAKLDRYGEEVLEVVAAG